LKLEAAGRTEISQSVRYDNPLKQGLKHPSGLFVGTAPTVRYDNPLKQGLKHPPLVEALAVVASDMTIH